MIVEVEEVVGDSFGGDSGGLSPLREEVVVIVVLASLFWIRWC